MTAKQFLAQRQMLLRARSDSAAYQLLSQEQQDVFKKRRALPVVTALFLVDNTRWGIADLLNKYQYQRLQYKDTYPVIYTMRTKSYIEAFFESGWYSYELTETGIAFVRDAQQRLDKYSWSWYANLI